MRLRIAACSDTSRPVKGLDWDPMELSFYRDRTIGYLRRYFRSSLELGRLPSVLGREIFRARVTSYRMHTFEDAVIFVHDVERCLELVDRESLEMVARVIFQDYNHDEAARLLGCSRKTITRKLPIAIDVITRIFLQRGLLSPMVEESGVRIRRARRVKAIEACSEQYAFDWDSVTGPMPSRPSLSVAATEMYA